MIYATYTEGTTNSRWWQLKYVLIFTPIWEDFPIWRLHIFQMGGSTTNQNFWCHGNPAPTHDAEPWWQRNPGRRSSEKPTPPSSSLLAYDLCPKVVIHGHLQDRRKRWKIPCRTLCCFFFFVCVCVCVGCWQKMKHVLVVTVWNSLIKALLKKQWGTNLWAGSWTGMAVNRKTPPINSFRIYPPKKHISHMTHPYMPWYLFYLFNLLCYVWVKDSWPVRVQAPSNVRRFFSSVCCDGHFRPRIVGVIAEAGVAFVTGVVWEMLAVARARRETEKTSWGVLSNQERKTLPEINIAVAHENHHLSW